VAQTGSTSAETSGRGAAPWVILALVCLALIVVFPPALLAVGAGLVAGGVVARRRAASPAARSVGTGLLVGGTLLLLAGLLLVLGVMAWDGAGLGS
jgi:hypothetical protein